MRDSSDSSSSSRKSSSSYIDGSEDARERSHPPTKTPAPTPFSYPSYGDNGANEDDDDDDDDVDDDDEDESNLLEIMIETLTGTSFQVRVSPWETAGGLKDLLHRTQGIPSCHQHILIGQQELLDELPLIDQGVQDGSSLKLILSMKGGPINSVRVPTHEDAIWKEFNTYMEMNKEELWEGNNGRQVTLLVLREGDDVNIYRVIENADGTFSPHDESWGSNSFVSGKTDSSSDKESKFQEDARMHQRIADLRGQMEALHLKKQEKKRRKKVPLGKASLKTSKSSAKGRRLKPRASLNKLELNNPINELKEEAIASKDFFKINKITPEIGTHKMVPPLKRLPSTHFNSRPSTSSQQFSHRSDLTSRPPSQMMPPTPLDSDRLTQRKRKSRPTTQEKGLDTRRSSISSKVVLDEIPHSLPPIQVDFSRRKRLESIRAQRERNNPLGPLTEDSTNNSASHRQYFRKSLIEYTNSNVGQNEKQSEVWPRSGVPIPLYMDPPRTKRKHRSRRLFQSFNSDILKFPKELDDRPKTSPEILAAKRPGTGSTNSTMSDRIQLRGPDERLREIINILNNSRTSSRGSRRSLEMNNSSSKWHQTVNPSGFISEKVPFHPDKSLSMSLKSFQASPPSNSSTPRVGISFPTDRKEMLKELVRAQGIGIRPSSRKSTPDTFRKKKSPSSKNSTPSKFPP